METGLLKLLPTLLPANSVIADAYENVHNILDMVVQVLGDGEGRGVKPQ
jgi:hypothetical protein